MLDSNQILKLLPNLDCGLCSNPSCATLSRKISRQVQKVEDCPLMTKDNTKRVQKLLESAEPEPQMTKFETNEYYDEEIIEIQPCAEYGRVTLEAHLPRPQESMFDLFDSCDMCLSFSDIKSLTNVKCSLDMGYGLAQSDERRIHVFKTGKIMIRRAKDRADAVSTLKLISYSLGPAIICSCGNSLADCLSGGCVDCTKNVGSGLKWLFSSFEYTEKSTAEILKPVFGRYSELIDDSLESENLDSIIDGLTLQSPEDKILLKAYVSLKILIRNLEKLDKILVENKKADFESLRDPLYDNLRDISKYSNEYLVNDLESKPSSEALILLGLCRNLRRMVDGFLSLKDPIKDEDVNGAYSEIRSMIFTSLNAFINCDATGAGAVEDEFVDFQLRWQDKLKKNSYPHDIEYDFAVYLSVILLNFNT
jgi:hypothetical protein